MEVWSPCLLSGLYWKYLGARRRHRFGYYWQSSLQEPIRFDLLNCLPADPVWFSIMPEHRKITWTTATIIIIPVKMNKIETNEKLWSSSSNTRIFAGNVEVPNPVNKAGQREFIGDGLALWHTGWAPVDWPMPPAVRPFFSLGRWVR